MAPNNPKFFASSKPHVLVLISALLLLRSRVITGPRDLFHKLSKVGINRHLIPSELSEALQQLYVEESDGTRQLLVPSRNSISKVRSNHESLSLLLTLRPRHQVPIHTTPDHLFSSHKPHFPVLPPAAQNKPNVDRAFLRQLLAILRITFPSYRSSEVGIVLVHNIFLVLRTVLSVGVAKLDGKIVKALVSCCYPSFVQQRPTTTYRLVQMALAFSAASDYGSCWQFLAYTRIPWCRTLRICTFPCA
jgi:ATP-binding cassette, subfamily D (ALD), peroxisomal long-chain fatty acid import protein